MKILKFIIPFFLGSAVAQNVMLDPEFNSLTGFNGDVSSIEFQNNNKIIVAGSFTVYNGEVRNKIARLNENGTLDESFQSPSTGWNIINGGLSCTAIQSDGKIIIGGGSIYNGTNVVSGVNRLNSDGSPDLNFNSLGTGINGSSGSSVHGLGIQDDGKIIAVGSFSSYNGNLCNNIVRINTDGTFDPSFNIGAGFIAGSWGCQDLKIQQDGKIIVVGGFSAFNGVIRNNIVRLNSDGTLDPSFNIGTGFDYLAQCVTLQPDGKILVGGAFQYYNGAYKRKIVRLNTDGTADLSYDSGNVIGNNYVSSIDIASNGKIIVGNADSWISNFSYGIVRLNSNGTLDSAFDPGPGFNAYVLTCKIQDGDNILVGGQFNSYNGLTSNFISKLIPVSVLGKVFYDYNVNCIEEIGDFGINGFNLEINPGNIVTTTNSNGIWFLDSLPAGNYTVTIDTTNTNWTTVCPVIQSFSVTDPDGFVNSPNFGIVNNCVDPSISVYAPTLRRCFPNQLIYVSACNNISISNINSAYVDVKLDSLILLNSANIPYTVVGNNVFRFQVGTLTPEECTEIVLSTTINCTSILGQTLCIDASLMPIAMCSLDTIPANPIIIYDNQNNPILSVSPCELPWDQSSLDVEGWCANDSIYFRITNSGQLVLGDMECYSPIWITVDGEVTYHDSIMLAGGEVMTLAFPGNGQTWILNTEQHPLHPGNSHPNAFVEACGSDVSNWTPNLVNDFPQDDADPFIDIYCGVVSGSFDPNDKTGYPKGYTNQYYIQPNQQMQYVIRFQNTGTDTAFTVVIRDTLDTDLNIFTVTPGVSSHNYEFRMYGPRVLEWKFNNINLPDSTNDLQGSNGFITFNVDQVSNLAPLTEITNEADIYFDYNDPIITNTTIHRVYEGYLSILDIEDLKVEENSLFIYPNPTSNLISIIGKDGMKLPFAIFDQMGKLVFNGELNGISTEINLTDLSKGIFILKIEGNYQPVKIIKN